MPLKDRRGDLDVIARDECLELLRGRTYGRLGVTSAGQPVVLPINYAMDDERIVFRTGAGGKFHAMVHGARVAFEIDEIDAERHAGWSVLATGRVEEVTDEAEQQRLEAQSPITPWADGERSHWMVIPSPRISGRRIGPSQQVAH